MKTIKNSLKSSEVLPMSESTKARIEEVAKAIKGKDLFKNKVEIARKNLSNVKSLPL
jgi:hypothetical protein